MKERLPVYVEERNVEELNIVPKKSQGFINGIFLTSMIITISSILTIIIFRK